MSQRLYCGDCRTVISAEGIDLSKVVVVTDPPFNIGYHYKSYKDRMAQKEYVDMMIGFIKNPSVIIHYPESLYEMAVMGGVIPCKVVSWIYNSNLPRQHRDIAFFNVKPDFAKVRQPYKNTEDKRIQERIENGSEGSPLYDWWQINQVKNVSADKEKHPCQMPLTVMENIIGILPDDAVILDPFMGSGTTGVACRNLGRDFIGIELDADYFALAQKRINEYQLILDF